jgi:hypothetical protein
VKAKIEQIKLDIEQLELKHKIRTASFDDKVNKDLEEEVNELSDTITKDLMFCERGI